MIKRILLVLSMLLLTGYLAVALTVLNRPTSGKECAGVDIVVADSASTCFITPGEIAGLLKRAKLYPVGWLMDSIRGKVIEQALEKNNFIANAECYKTPSGNLCIRVEQRIPVLRVFGRGGENYYVDEKGCLMPGGGHAAHLPVATGAVSREFATKELYELAMLLREDSFWNKQVQQINVTSEGEIELVPRVGNHLLFLGKPVSLREKLDRIRTFYGKALSTVGWNRYSRISVEFDNQVICKRIEN